MENAVEIESVPPYIITSTFKATLESSLGKHMLQSSRDENQNKSRLHLEFEPRVDINTYINFPPLGKRIQIKLFL